MGAAPAWLPYVVAAVSTAGSVYSTMQQQEAAAEQERARKEAIVAEGQRQKQYQEEAEKTVADTLGQFDTGEQGKKQQSIADALSDQYQSQVAPTTTATQIAGAQTAPKEVQESIADQMANSNARQQAQASALAKLSSYGNLADSNNTAVGRNAQTLGQIVGNMNSSSAVLPYELNAANMAGRNHIANAEIGQGLGSIASIYAGTMGGGAKASAPISYYSPQLG